MRKPLRKIVHTMGWPLRTSPSFGEFGGSFIYPDGRRPRHDRLRRRARGDRRRVLRARRAPGVQDAPPRLEDPRRRRARRLGREDDHRRWLSLASEQVQRAGSPAGRRRRRARQRATTQGRPLRDRVGQARGRGGVPGAAARRGGWPCRRTRLLRRVAAREQAPRRSSTRCGTCARRSTRASSSAARSRA